MAKLVAHLLATNSSLGSNPDISQKEKIQKISQKYKMGNINKGVAYTLKLSKK
jgi:hypothetical protein